MNKDKKHAKITCHQCGHVNLFPVDRILKISTPMKCQRCGTVIAQPE